MVGPQFHLVGISMGWSLGSGRSSIVWTRLVVSSMEATMDFISSAFPVIHSCIFLVGVSTNGTLLLAVFRKTPKILESYSVMIKLGAINDLISVFCDFLTMQRLIIIPGNLLYLSNGPCITARACFLIYCVQFCTMIYGLYVMAASFSYRLWVFYYPTPKSSSVLFVMIILLIPPATLASTFTFAQADAEVVREFLIAHAPFYLTEPGVLSGHTGMTPHLIFTIIFVILSPGYIYATIIVIRHKIIVLLRKNSLKMSERTRKMHSNLIQALTVHAMLPPITILGAIMYAILYFDLYRHAALEKAIYTVAAIPTALGALCTIYYVEPYRKFIFRQGEVVRSKQSASTTINHHH